MLLLVSSAAVSQDHSSPPHELAFRVNPAQGKGERWNWASHFIFLHRVESHRSLCSQNCGKVDRSRIYACGGIGNSSSGSCNPDSCLGTCLNFSKELISILGEGLSTVTWTFFLSQPPRPHLLVDLRTCCEERLTWLGPSLWKQEYFCGM